MAAIDWDSIITVLIMVGGIGFWILKNILDFRQANPPDRPPAQPRPIRRPVDRAPDPAKAEQVWEEMLRRRRQMEEGKAAPVPPKKTPAQAAAEQKRQMSKQLEAQRKAQQREEQKRRRVQDRPELRTVVEVPKPVEPPLVVVAAETPVEPAPALKTAFVPTGTARTRHKKAAVSSTVVQLLRNPNTLQTAMALRELFDAPLSRRPPGRTLFSRHR